mmetsp:Transcript_49849/g.112099  ORF Transcript_49849/g.112099 Transcript_49849/m.112099 type:complete len:402 (+) Transcript_49849:3-1208(+)
MTELSITAETADDCQQLCQLKPGCACFSYYPPLKSCHFASVMSELKTGRLGFQGGHVDCDKALQGVNHLTVMQETRERNCMVNVSFSPLSCSRSKGTTYEQDPVLCQRRCKDAEWCSSFVYNTLTKSCDLQCEDATAVMAPAYSLSGPPTCNMAVNVKFTVSCPGSFDHEVKEWGSVLTQVLPILAGNYMNSHEKMVPVLKPSEVDVSVTKKNATSWHFFVNADVQEARSMYLYWLLKSNDTSQQINAQIGQVAHIVASRTMTSRCQPDVRLDSVERDVRGDSFKSKARQQLQHTLARYSAARPKHSRTTGSHWLFVGALMAAVPLGAWTILRWNVHTWKCRSCCCNHEDPETDVSMRMLRPVSKLEDGDARSAIILCEENPHDCVEPLTELSEEQFFLPL